MKCSYCSSETTDMPCTSCPSIPPDDSSGLPVGLFIGSILADEVNKKQQKKKKTQFILISALVFLITVIIVIAIFSHFRRSSVPSSVEPAITTARPEPPAPPIEVRQELGEIIIPYEPEEITPEEPEEIEPPGVQIPIEDIIDELVTQVIEYPVFVAADFEIKPRAVLYIQREELTDEVILAFLEVFDITYFNWFTFDFGDGTGIVFGGGNHTFFGYGILDEEGTITYDYHPSFAFANIHDGLIDWHFRVYIPEFHTVGEYLQWATGNGFELIVLNREFEQIEDIQAILHHKVFEHPKPIFDGDIEIEIIIDD